MTAFWILYFYTSAIIVFASAATDTKQRKLFEWLGLIFFALVWVIGFPVIAILYRIKPTLFK